MEEKELKKGEVLNVEISRHQRNNIFYHLGIPYRTGKNIHNFTIRLGKATINKSFDAGKKVVTIGDLVGKKISEEIKAVEVKVIKTDKKE